MNAPDVHPPVQVWWLRVDRLTEPAVAPWLPLLDAEERQRAARFRFARNRIEYVAAHALARLALSALSYGIRLNTADAARPRESGDPAFQCPTPLDSRVRGNERRTDQPEPISDAPPTPPAAWRFAPGPHGKPEAILPDGRASGLRFNLSHTEGLVAVAATSRPLLVGIDVEALARTVSPGLAERCFVPCERDWLAAAGSGQEGERFMRLWTLKEAYIKATGRGLSQALDAFWFESFDPPRIGFAPALADDPGRWHFAERVIDGRFHLALGLRQDDDGGVPGLAWREFTAGEMDRLVAAAVRPGG